jgi:hypothetical protein
MEQHTEETLAALSFRDLQQAAKSLDLIAQGNRDDLTLRILQTQAERLDSVPSDESSTPAGADTDTDTSAGEQPPAADEKVAEDMTVTAPSPEPTVPAPTSTSALRAISPATKKVAAREISGYISAERYDKDTEQAVLTALAEGRQPCIVKGEGNVKFALKIFDKIFYRGDLSSDIPRKRDGVVMNLSRRLADANLLPY